MLAASQSPPLAALDYPGPGCCRRARQEFERPGRPCQYDSPVGDRARRRPVSAPETKRPTRARVGR